jgi:uncharacterized protein YacL (UPF0231 family)
MEFQFMTDISGQPIAKCELECEAFGDWLGNDLGKDPRKVSQLLHTIDELLNKQLPHFELTTKEYHLSIEDDEVTLSLNNAQSQTEEFAEHYPDEQVTGCGLIDFQQLLKAWQQFI